MKLSKQDRRILRWMYVCCQEWEGMYTGSLEHHTVFKIALKEAKRLKNKLLNAKKKTNPKL